MTKQEMVQEIINAALQVKSINSRQLEVAFNRFMAHNKEYIEMCYNKMVSNKVEATFILRCASGIMF